MKKFLLFFFLIVISLFFANTALGQGAPACPSVIIAPPAAICNGSCTTLTSTLVTNNQTTSYSVASIPYVPYSYTTGTAAIVSTDDIWSDVENIGFNFCFFGNTYSQFVIGANGQIAFNNALANAAEPYTTTGATLPDGNTPIRKNTISFPYRDIDPQIPAAGESVKYQMYGTSPCRALVVSFYNVPLYDKGGLYCNGTPNSTFQCVLYENTNYIDVYIENSYSCSDWNGGTGVIGIQNSTGTVAVCPPGRNNTTFSVNGTPEAWRFTPTGTPSYTLNWYKVGSATSLGTTSTLSVCPTATTSYALVMTTTNCDGSSFNESDTAQVVVNTAPTVTATASASPICIGSSSTLTAAGATTYSWNTSATTNPITVTPTTTTSYTVTGTNAGCTGTAVVTVTVNPLPTVTVNSPTVCAGTAATLTGAGATTYSWSTGALTNPITVTPATTTSYTVTGTTAGCAGTAVATVTVNPLPVVTVNSPTVCAGTAATLTGAGATTYSWSTGALTNPITVTPATTTSYTVTGTTAGCAGTAVATVTVNPLPVVTVNSPTVCAGTAATLTGAGATTYSWSTGALTNPITVTPATTTSYTVTGTTAGCTGTAVATVTVSPLPIVTVNSATVCTGTSATLTGVGATTYSWSTTALTNPITVTPATTTTYTVTGTSLGCTGSAIATVTLAPNLVITVPPATICAGSSATLTATGGTTYSWSTGSTVNPLVISPAVTTAYTVTGTSGGCTGSTTVVVTVNSSPTITVNLPTICAGTSATLTAAGPAGTTYSWSTSATTNPITVTPATTTSYTVTGTDANGCTGSAVATVTVNPLPTVTVNSATVCTGTSATLTGVGATTYSWSTGALTNPITVTPATTASYTVTGTTAGCTGTAVATVTVAPNLAITITPSPITICAGSSATLTGSGGTTYLWSTGSTANPLVISPAATTTYTVTGTTGGCTGTATVLVTVDPTMVLGTTTTSATCGNNNGSATVAISSGGTAPYTYSWAPGGSTATTLTGLTAGTYSVTVTDANGCTQTATAVVPNAGGPTATVGTVTNVTCFGAANGSIVVTGSSGVTPYTYSWSPGGQTTATATTLSPGAYTLTVNDANGCSVTATASITQPTALDTTTNYVNILCNGGTNGSATINVTGGTGAYTYVWTPNVSTTGAATGLGAGTYSVIVNDANGCSISKTFVLTQPSLLKASAGGFSATCFGTCNGYAVVIPSGGTAPYTYSWTPSGNTTANANNLCAGNYCIKLTDANGCNVDTCVTVSQPTILALNTTTTTANCSQANGSTSVNATGGTGTYTYLWAPSGQTTATATAITAGTYTVTVTDGNSCTQTATAVVPNAPGVVASIASSTNDGCFGTCDGTATSLATSGTAPYNYSWNAVPAQTTAEATGLCAGTYTVSITDATGCSNTASVTITQPTQITVSPSAATTICIGQSTILSANAAGGTPAYTYSWNNIYNGQDYTVSPTTTPTTYTVVVTDADGCISAPQTVVVNLNPPLAVIAKNDTSLCLGGHASLSAMGSGGNGTYNYAWQPGALSGSPISVTPNTTTIYTVTVTDNCGTPPATNTVTVTVNPLPVVSFSADTVSGCYPLCVTFTNLSTPASASATWEFGDGNTANTIATASNCYQIPNSYNVTLTVTDNLGCSNSTTLNDMITVYPHPTANFSMSPQPATIMNPTVFFKDLSTGTVNQWEWNLGDVPNSSSNLQNPQYTYPDTGYYNVQLIVTNNFGCTDSITKTVYIEGQFVIYVPNAFTPNGDGINDTFYPKGTGIDPNNYQMYIFDRWGNMLFYTTSLNQGWNGKVEGDSQLVQEDVYVWKIICKDFLGNNHQYIGHVSVVR